MYLWKEPTVFRKASMSFSFHLSYNAWWSSVFESGAALITTVTGETTISATGEMPPHIECKSVGNTVTDTLKNQSDFTSLVVCVYLQVPPRIWGCNPQDCPPAAYRPSWLAYRMSPPLTLKAIKNKTLSCSSTVLQTRDRQMETYLT